MKKKATAMPKSSLWEFQKDLIEQINHESKKHRSLFLQLATGGGKTHIASSSGIGDAAKRFGSLATRHHVAAKSWAAIKETFPNALVSDCAAARR